MKILFVRPKVHGDSIGLQSFMSCEPLEFEYLAAYLKPHGHDIEFLDLSFETEPLSWFLGKLQPQVVGFSGFINHIGVIKDTAALVKKYNNRIVTIVGGVHAEVVPRDFEDDSIDYIAHINGPKAFKELLAALPDTPEHLKATIKGLWIGQGKNYDGAYFSPLPMPDRALSQKYRKHYRYVFLENCASIKTSLGCPFHCEFCFCIKASRNRYIPREPEEVIAELQTINEKNVFIVDDNFFFNHKRLNRICDLLEEQQIKKKYIVFGRVDFVNKHPETVTRLKKHGLSAVFLGVESFRAADLANFNKQASVEQNIKAIQTLNQLGIETHCGIILGPDWSRNDFHSLIKTLNSFKLVFANFMPLTPLPGTSSYEKYKSQLAIPRERHELWDLMHVMIQPEKMSLRSYYWNIIKAYLLTTLRLKTHRYILGTYGFKTYCRSLIAAAGVSWRYLRLLINPKVAVSV